MIVLFTDFGTGSPYLGQMKGAILREHPQARVVDLLADAPAFDPRASAYLLAAYPQDFPAGAVFLAVVDPGVGDPRRRAAAVRVDGQWFVGPDNGLFNVVARRGREVAWWDLRWRPPRLSATFHGRDLFAPVAARLDRGEPPPGEPVDPAARIDRSWPEDLAQVIYVDPFGNCITGLRAAALPAGAVVEAAGRRLPRARAFHEVPVGQPFWYENANGLVELAVNQGRCDRALGLAPGSPVRVAEEAR
ncbi:MAG: hypothetical protein D6809_00110 [Gammaproteobacteria bacterium]|nr:MAG: hypothetical protein D6809_00110 [Gammaproteobacteria bacterium]